MTQRQHLTILAMTIMTVMLSGCVDQVTADQKMSKGCKAGIEAMIEPKEIMEIQSTRYDHEDIEGEGLHRVVIIEAVEKDGWLELEKEYRCLFAEQWGILRATHTAALIQLNIDGDIIGKKNGEIHGSLDDFMTLTEKVKMSMSR